MSAFTDALKQEIEDTLLGYEPQRQAVEDAALGLLNLNKKPYQTLNNALARTDAWHDRIAAEQAAGNLYPWLSPRLAAMAFEGVFETSVAAWLAAGPPADPTTLKPSIARLIDLQVRAFATAIGDQ